MTHAVLPLPPGWEDPDTPPDSLAQFSGPEPDSDTLGLDNDDLLINLDSNTESDLTQGKAEVNGFSDGMVLNKTCHDQPLDLFCREQSLDLSPKEESLHLAPSSQNMKKQVKVHRVTLHKTAGGVQFLVDPPLPNTLSSHQVIPLLSSLSVPISAAIPIPHPINTKEAQVVELKTTDLDTPVQSYENEKGEKVFEFQIPPFTPDVSSMTELHSNLASSPVAEGEPLEPSMLDSSMRPLFRVTPGPPISSALDSAVVDSIIESIPMVGTRCRTWVSKVCGKFF